MYLKQVAARTDGLDGQTESFDAAPKPQHVHIEGVSSRSRRGPAGTSQLLATHNGTELPDQLADQAGFDRR